MNSGKVKLRHLGWALPMTFAVVLGGCALQQPSARSANAQGIKPQPVQTQPVKVQSMRIVVQKLNVRQVYASAIAALTFSPDSKTLASAGGTAINAVYANMPGGSLKVEMLDAQTLHPRKTLPPLPAADFVAFSPNLKRIVTNPSVYEGLQLIDATTGKSLWQEFTQLPDYPPLPRGADTTQHILQLAFSPRGDKVLTSDAGGRFSEGGMSCWFVEKQKLRHAPYMEDTNDPKVPGLEDEVLCYRAAFSPDSKTYIIGSQENTLALVDTQTDKMIWAQEKYYKEQKFEGNINCAIQTITFSLDGKTIATGHADNSVCLWSAHNGQLLRTLKVHSSPVQIVVFSPDGTILVSGSDDGAVVLSSTRNGETLSVLPSQKSVTALAFAPDEKHLAAGYADGKIALWRVR